MKIVCIFTDRLFSFHYDGESDNEYDRLMELWTDVDYLYDFAHRNNVADIDAFVYDTLRDAENLQDFIEETHPLLDAYFLPLDDIAWKTQYLSFQKGKIIRKRLRLYAIKLDDNCFVITGGAIKMSQAMQDHPDTDRELGKLKSARLFLHHNHVFDESSFFEYLSEEND